jgi:hypothetical protein
MSKHLLAHCRENKALPIVAIELQSDGDAKPRVFTPLNVKQEIWQVCATKYLSHAH